MCPGERSPVSHYTNSVVFVNPDVSVSLSDSRIQPRTAGIHPTTGTLLRPGRTVTHTRPEASSTDRRRTIPRYWKTPDIVLIYFFSPFMSGRRSCILWGVPGSFWFLSLHLMTSFP